MNDLRLWITVLALTAFAAGAGVGVWGTARALREEPAPSTFADYEALLSERFQLSPERRKHLHHLLDAYEKDLQEVRERRSVDLLASMEPDLIERGRYYRALIQDKVLPEHQRAEFARLAFQPNPAR